MTTPAPIPNLTSHGTKHTLAIGPLRMTVDAAAGGRIVEFSHDGRNVLSGTDINPNNYGSTFWPSPQSLWGWPPIAALDSGPYTGGPAGNTLVLKSGPGKSGDAADAPVFTVEKHFAPVPELPAVDVTYVLANASPPGSPAVEVAPWQITRVRGTQGLTFFALGPGPVQAAPGLPLHEEDGIAWYAFSPAAGDSKTFADGQGWLAHVTGEHLLFLLRFPDLAPGDSPDGESEVELYTGSPATAGDYVELEPQGAKRSLAPGQSLRYTVRFILRPLPENLAATVGNYALVDYVLSI